MKHLLFSTMIAVAFITTAVAQTTPDIPVQNISTDSNVVYRLFATRNMYTFIKLNTRNGQLWQVQWGTQSKYRLQSVLSEIPRVTKDEEQNG